MIRLVIIATCISAIVVGCSIGDRQPAHDDHEQSVAQAVSDARAGLDAFAKAPGVSYDASAAQILAGVGEYTLAAAGKTTLPMPRMAPGAILASPSDYHSEAATARQHADGSFALVWLAGAGSVALAVATALAKNLGGPVGAVFAPMASSIANGVWHAFAPQVAKDADDRAHMIAGHVSAVADAITTIAPDYVNKLPPNVAASVNAIRGV